MAVPAVLLDPRRGPALAGARNVRDLGGYAAADGRTVRWGLLYRAGSLAGLTDEGVAALRGLGLAGVCDLRTTSERAAQPYAWADALGLVPWSRDYETSFGELRALMEAGFAKGEDARAAMLAGYRRLPHEQAPAYRALFGRLAAGAVPLLFNCSAGKDRAGTAAALVLAAIGVPRATIAADYALTDRFGGLDAMLAAARADPRSLLGRQPEAVARAILGCDPAYIAAALDAVAPSDEAFAAYLRDALGIDADARRAIADRLLEPPAGA